MKTSKLVKHQIKTLDGGHDDDGNSVVAIIRFDDNCNNGSNDFSICGTVYEKGKRRIEKYIISGGQCTDEIIQAYPQLKHLMKWHLVSAVQPMHYLANTLYHAKNLDLEYARKSAVWEDATLEQLQDETALKARLPQLMIDFQKDIEEFGFIY
jgi:hypothetical protein